MEMKKALLVISFGTSYPETRKKTIEVIEKDLQSAFPDRTFYRAWTSGIIRKKIRERDGIEIPSIEEALERIAEEKVTDLLIQPSLILAGNEFNKIVQTVQAYESRIEKIRICRPLLDTENDISEMVTILDGILGEQTADGILAFMGHGSEDMNIPVYDLMNQYFIKKGLSRFCMGTVEFEPGFEPVEKKVKDENPGKVYLTPFLIVAGDHALNDMSGDEEDSWKNRIAAMGPEVTCIVKGLGEYSRIRNLFVAKAKEAL